jgi:hypothetical protein
MKTKHILVLLLFWRTATVKAEINPISISGPYSIQSSSESLEPFGNGYLTINYNYDYNAYDDWGMPTNQKPTEITLYDSTMHPVKKIRLSKINRWNQRIEISKDGKNIFVLYQPNRWNRSVAGGTVKLCMLDKNLTCTRICKFIIPGSRPAINGIQKISSSHIIVDGTFINRGNQFLLNVDMNTGKFTSFKLPKRNDYYAIRHYAQDGKTIVLSRSYESSGDSLRLCIYSNAGVLLRRQWIVMNQGFSMQDVGIMRIGKNKYAFYGQGFNKDLGTGHENNLAVFIYENGKITKKVIINESVLNFAARNDFSKLGLTAARENSRTEFEANRKNVREYYPPTLSDLQLFSNGNFYLYAGIYQSESQGGVVIEFDEDFKIINTNTFPIVERQTVKPNSYNYANGRCFVNSKGFYYAYTIESDVSGIFVDRSGNVNSFAFETNAESTPAISIVENGFLVCNSHYDPAAESGKEYFHEARKIFAQ